MDASVQPEVGLCGMSASSKSALPLVLSINVALAGKIAGKARNSPPTVDPNFFARRPK